MRLSVQTLYKAPVPWADLADCGRALTYFLHPQPSTAFCCKILLLIRFLIIVPDLLKWKKTNLGEIVFLFSLVKVAPGGLRYYLSCGKRKGIVLAFNFLCGPAVLSGFVKNVSSAGRVVVVFYLSLHHHSSAILGWCCTWQSSVIWPWWGCWVAQAVIILECCLKAHQNRMDIESVEADTWSMCSFVLCFFYSINKSNAWVLFNN